MYIEHIMPIYNGVAYPLKVYSMSVYKAHIEEADRSHVDVHR